MSVLLALALAAAGPIVTTDDGPVRGAATAGGGAVFRGIRYGAPPTGALRWRAPVRPRRWTTPIAAVADHAACPQSDYGTWNRAAARGGSEDCLFVDVRTPRLTPTAKLPVLVWIHGGGNRGGAGGGTVESRITERGIVVVGIQYRLGALGFLSHAALSAEDGGHSGNYALMDQQLALRWVQRNIARFGGDPRRVTIAGESAGAQDVALQQLSPLAHGLFHAAIQESGTAGFGVPPRSLAQNEAVGALFARAAGLAPDGTAAQLRALPVDRVLAAQDAIVAPGLEDNSFIWLQAVVDGRVLPDTPARLLARGRVNPVPLIIGTNARELPLHGDLSAAPGIVTRAFGSHAGAALAYYGLAPGRMPVSDPRLGSTTDQIATDLTFRCPTRVTAAAVAGYGGSVWQYAYDYTAPDGTAVTHGSELRSVFGTPATGLERGAPPLQSYWVQFVRTGNPNATGSAPWPEITATSPHALAFTNAGPIVRDATRLPCLWRNAA
ncbi:carboxylesterase family protein [Sphingomonas sp. TREG-RG-20F-R18-01]|uniref:carboxylesterase/lipase family protein n=1 Tax=Sphingomonas sp. TREG-RG-20F-R18-01 TaxID=2914982 RepID=UPI001F57218B